MKGYAAASTAPAKRRWKYFAIAVLALVFFSLLVPLGFLLGRFPSGYLTEERPSMECRFGSGNVVDANQEKKDWEGDKEKIKDIVNKLSQVFPKVVDLVRRAVPLALTPEGDPRREELKELQKKKEEIDTLAHKQVRRILWSGLGFSVFQVGLFFRLTFWEFSWDVMEPIAFFSTTTGLVVGYAYFLITSRDPTYQDLMKRLFLSRQRKLFEKKGFNTERFKELQRHCKCPLDHIEGTGLDALHKD